MLTKHQINMPLLSLLIKACESALQKGAKSKKTIKPTISDDKHAGEATYSFCLREEHLNKNTFTIDSDGDEIKISFNSLLSVELSAPKDYQGIFSFLREEKNFQLWSDLTQSWEDGRIFIQDVQENGNFETKEVFPITNPWENFQVVGGQTYDELVALEQGLK